MKRDNLDIVICPQCKGSLEPSRLRGRAEVGSGSLRCGNCHQDYPIMTGVPSLLPDLHSFPIWFLPPEDIMATPSATGGQSDNMNGLEFVVSKRGKAAFMRAVRRKANAPTRSRLHVPRASLLSRADKQKGYQLSRPAFVRDIMESVMQQRFWPDERCIAMVETLQELKPERLLDIATGPGGLLCAAMPRLQHTQAIGLEIFFDKCRLVMAEAAHFGFPDRLDMVHGDARLMPFPDASFDCVSGWTAAYHISRYELALRESARVLCSGGHFVGTFHTVYPSHCPDLLTRAEEEEFIRCAHLPLNIREVCGAFRACGFVISRKWKVKDSHMVVARKK